MVNEQDFVKDLTSMEGIEPDTDLEESRLDAFEVTPVISNPNRTSDDVRCDYATVRGSMHMQHQMLLEAARVSLEFARNTESPRAMEAFSAIMKQLSEVNLGMTGFHNEMMKLEEQRRKLEGQDSNKVIESEGMFYGNPADLMEQEGSLAEVRRLEADADADDIT